MSHPEILEYVAVHCMAMRLMSEDVWILIPASSITREDLKILTRNTATCIDANPKYYPIIETIRQVILYDKHVRGWKSWTGNEDAGMVLLKTCDVREYITHTVVFYFDEGQMDKYMSNAVRMNNVMTMRICND